MRDRIMRVNSKGPVQNEWLRMLVCLFAPFNSFAAKFQTTFVVCFSFLFLFFLTNHCLESRLYVKLKDCMSNSVDPDETAH